MAEYTFANCEPHSIYERTNASIFVYEIASVRYTYYPTSNRTKQKSDSERAQMLDISEI